MEGRAEEVSALLRLLSNRSRLMILCQLVGAERAVNELGEALGLPQPAVSQQLAVLRREGLVDSRRAGQQVFYSLPEGRVSALIGFLYETFCD
ncbi:MAG: ArsR/SmtB family transcription factor [Gammaproteobacteria bacterium]